MSAIAMHFIASLFWCGALGWLWADSRPTRSDVVMASAFGAALCFNALCVVALTFARAA